MSPDGLKIVFARYWLSGANTTGSALYLMSANGTGATRLTITAASDYQQQPTWSPDGTRFAFAHKSAGGVLGIYTMNADGSNWAPLSPTLPTKQQTAPNWSPDGTKILYNRFPSSSATWVDVVVANANGTGETVLNLPAETTWHAYPNWQRLPATSSPAQLAFTQHMRCAVRASPRGL